MMNKAKLYFLGTGTSGGVPSLGCTCEVCKSSDPHDSRLRTAAMIETASTRLLIDCGPDIRQQLMDKEFRRIDGVLVTHSHYDHVGGVDDLRPYCTLGDIDLYANSQAVRAIKQMMYYCFTDRLYPGVPRLRLNTIYPHKPLIIGDIQVMPVEVVHDKLPILGFRIGSLAYITDIKYIDNANMELIRGVDCLVVSALRWEKPHHSHFLVSDALKLSRAIGAKETWLTHLTHKIGLHSLASSMLPPNVHLAYDGGEVEFCL